VTKLLTTLLLGWAFLGQSPKGRSRGVILRWRTQKEKLQNSWEMDSVLRGDFLLEVFEKSFTLLNVYGPHSE
jgi:hypothetical protein